MDCAESRIRFVHSSGPHLRNLDAVPLLQPLQCRAQAARRRRPLLPLHPLPLALRRRPRRRLLLLGARRGREAVVGGQVTGEGDGGAGGP
jgi:hypothetical protein